MGAYYTRFKHTKYDSYKYDLTEATKLIYKELLPIYYVNINIKEEVFFDAYNKSEFNTKVDYETFKQLHQPDLEEVKTLIRTNKEYQKKLKTFAIKAFDIINETKPGTIRSTPTNMTEKEHYVAKFMKHVRDSAISKRTITVRIKDFAIKTVNKHNVKVIVVTNNELNK